MDNSKVIKIAASVTASTRWAIAGMMADGAQFRWANELWFEVVSALFSLAFAVVEIWATSYIMQAQHKAQANGQVERARNLLILWVSTLVVLALALVPAMYANVIKTPISSFSPLVVIAWLACVAASTFLVIGGVGYADEAETSKPAQPTASPSQVGATMPQGQQTATDDTPNDTADDDRPIESPQMPTGSDLSVSVSESALSTVLTKSPLESPVLSTVTFDDYQLTGDTRADLRALLNLAPLATNASLARKLNKSPERVRQIKESLSQEMLAKAMQ